MLPHTERLTPLETGFEGYPPEYVAQNAPFIVLSGLKDGEESDEARVPEKYRDGALRIHCDLPPVTGPQAEELLKAFRRFERGDDQWDPLPVVEGSNAMGFKFKVTSRMYELLPRKAKPPSQDLGYDLPGSPTSRSPPLWVLHSPISPLTPGASLFPDGVMSSEWIRKHSTYVPSVFMAFFDFTTDPTRNSLMDNQLKTEINNIKATLYRSEYKTKLTVVLIGDSSIEDASEIEDRLNNIRRATGLDMKTSLFFLPPHATLPELQAFADGVLTALQPGCVEYYRDLTKHARRKKGRGSIPAPTAPPTRGTSQTLAALGWGVRYDFKLGVFAEFRQEMESACRHYTSALESLLGQDGIFETTASWSPRWEESRVLADMVAMRILRCLLWSNLTSTAVQSWSNYRYRLRELVDRRGKGSSNYGWEAWESRWSRTMAELVKRAQLKIFLDQDSGQFNIYAPIEKAIPVGERIRPFEYLHHPGYWYRMAAKRGRRRRRLANELPEEDCTPPGQSPASAMASRYGTYDTYLCPEPWQERPNSTRKTYNHSKDIFNALENAQGHFRAQPRSRGELCLDMSKELIRNHQYPEAMKLLFQLWTTMSWRKDQWWGLVLEVTRSLHECAKHIGDLKVVAATEFEMYCKLLAPTTDHKYDLMRCGQEVKVRASESAITDDTLELDSDSIAAPFSTTFTFAVAEGSAGEPLEAQLAVTSLAQAGSTPIVFDSIDVCFAGPSFTVSLMHSDAHATEPGQIQRLVFEVQDDAIKTTSASLLLEEGQTVVFELPLIFREATQIAVESIVLSLSTPAAPIRFRSMPEELTERSQWFKEGPRGFITTTIAREDSHTANIRPRPPKMDIKLPNAEHHFYTDEEVELEIELMNGEDETADVSIDVQLLTDDGPAMFKWREGQGNIVNRSKEQANLSVGTIEPGAKSQPAIIFTAPALPTAYTVEIKVSYHLLSDPATPISKVFTADLNVTRAFEANYEFQPRTHSELWPSFFNSQNISTLDSNDSHRYGIAQRWELLARIASFTYEGVIMSSAELRLESISSHAAVTFTTTEVYEGETEIAPQQQVDREFIVDVVKASLDDRRSVDIELMLAISWHRPRSSKEFTSLLPVNTFVLENGPRVLAAVSYPSLPIEDVDDQEAEEDDDVVRFTQLTFTLENPTNHFLTFELTMEGPQTEGDWALSGMKMSSLNLLPLSRETVSYRIVPLTLNGGADSESRWLEVRFRVMDVYFRKVLRCLPASAGVRDAEGKGGNLLVWVGRKQG